MKLRACSHILFLSGVGPSEDILSTRTSVDKQPLRRRFSSVVKRSEPFQAYLLEFACLSLSAVTRSILPSLIFHLLKWGSNQAQTKPASHLLMCHY